jgi:hypothetical protein
MELSEFLMYLIIGAILYIFIDFCLTFIQAVKLINFFNENPHNLPSKLPPKIQEIKNEIGEEEFNKIYENYKERRND